MAIRTAKGFMAAVIVLICSGLSDGALAEDGWISSSTAADAEVASVTLAANEASRSTAIAHAIQANADHYDPYTCTAAYGDAFCAAFERCMAARGFDACYARLGQQQP